METQRDYPVVYAVLDVLVRWWKQGGSNSDLAGLGAGDVERIAKDLAVSTADLRALDQTCPVLLLPNMLKALKLDPAVIARVEPEVYRDLQRVCALCDVQKRCEGEIAEGDAPASYEDFCPNAVTLKALT